VKGFRSATNEGCGACLLTAAAVFALHIVAGVAQTAKDNATSVFQQLAAPRDGEHEFSSMSPATRCTRYGKRAGDPGVSVRGKQYG